MTVRFLEDTSNQHRPGKVFIMGKEYVLGNTLAAQLIAQGACVPVKPVELSDFKPVNTTKPKKKKTK